MSETRFLGNAAFGGRIYLVPAQHLLAFRMAPPRCLSPSQRLIEHEVRPLLQRQYRQAALCFEVLYGNADTIGIQGCAPATGTADAMLSTKGTPGFGLVPNGVSAVTVTYQTAPPRTVAVRRNGYVTLAPSETAPPCGVQWLDPTGNVKKIAVGCSYLTVERHELSEYRAYVARKLSTLKTQVAAMDAAIRSGDLANAQSTWLTAHLTWLEIGEDDGAYGAFGALGGKIDGLAAGHRLGTADPGFTGFHRIEFDLWTKHDLQAAANDAAILQQLLTKLMNVPLSTYLPGHPHRHRQLAAAPARGARGRAPRLTVRQRRLRQRHRPRLHHRRRRRCTHAPERARTGPHAGGATSPQRRPGSTRVARRRDR